MRSTISKMIDLKVLGSILFLLNICSFNTALITNRSLIVETAEGLVSGEEFIGKSQKTWYRYRGIPFAEPPVGDLRFEPPVPKIPWTGVLDGSRQRPFCIQNTKPVEGSEDCLFVKIYTPLIPHRRHKLPVLVYIYGGSFFMGAPDFDGGHPENLLNADVIVASFQYRVGIFGFLSTGDSNIPGNAGLKDQVLALRWIKNNIRNFGGDPERITLCGQSAGAASIAYLLQAPQTAGLYSAAIMLSGSSLNSWSLTRNPLRILQSISSYLSIPSRLVKILVTALKKLSVETLQALTTSFFKREIMDDPSSGLPLGPVIEQEHAGAIITGKSYSLLTEGYFHKVPIMIGHTSLEAVSDSGLSSAMKLLLRTFNKVPARLVPVGLNIKNNLWKAVIGQKIKSHYFGMGSINNGLQALIMISEDQFVRGIYEAAKLYSKKVPVYYYVFGYEGALSGIHDRTVPGVGHSEDLGYLFDYGYVGSRTDYLVRERYTKLITNFAKHRNPTPKEDILFENVMWPANTGDTNLIQLNITNKLDIVINPYSDNMAFWKKCYNEHGLPPFETY